MNIVNEEEDASACGFKDGNGEVTWRFRMI